MAKAKVVDSVKKELHRLCDENDGLIKPSDVVEYAKANKDSEIRRRLDAVGAFDRETALREYPLICARRLIMSVKIMIPDGAGDVFRVRAFTSLDGDRVDGTGYRPVMSVLSDGEMTKRMEATMLKELASMQARYSTFASMAKYRPVFDAMRKVTEKGGAQRKSKAG
jgi:hypothetical protein